MQAQQIAIQHLHESQLAPLLQEGVFQPNWLAVMLIEFCLGTKRQGEVTAMDGIEGGEAMQIHKVLQAYCSVCRENPPLRKLIVTLRPSLLNLAKLPGAKLILAGFPPLLQHMKEWFLNGDKELTQSPEFIDLLKIFINELDEIITRNADSFRHRSAR